MFPPYSCPSRIVPASSSGATPSGRVPNTHHPLSPPLLLSTFLKLRTHRVGLPPTVHKSVTKVWSALLFCILFTYATRRFPAQVPSRLAYLWVSVSYYCIPLFYLSLAERFYSRVTVNGRLISPIRVGSPNCPHPSSACMRASSPALIMTPLAFSTFILPSFLRVIL